MGVIRQALEKLKRTLLLATGIALLPLAGMAQYVASDACGYFGTNRYPVDEGCTPRPFHKPDTFTPTFDPGSCNSGPYADAYGWFTAISSTTSLTLAPNNSEDVILHILTGACGSLGTLLCVDDLGPGGSESTDVPTVIGQDYLIRVQTYGSNAPMPDAQICIYPTPPPPPNDDPCDAIFLDATTNCTSVVSSTNTSASETPGIPDPGCYYAGQPDVWYTAIAPPSGHLYVDSYAANGGGPGDSGMALYSAASCDQPMTLLGCNDDQDYPLDDMPAIDRSGLVPGDTVYIRLWAYYANQGAFLICASPDVSTLPVELLSFSATAQSDGILLEWSTASERNNDRFTVERSLDNIAFEPVGEVPGAGNSTAVLRYSLVDHVPAPGINYYRLAQTDKDGTTQRSWTEACMAAVGPTVLLYPNPVHDLLTVQLAEPMANGATLWINGAVDRIMAEVPIQPMGDGRSLTVDTRRSTPGTYFLSSIDPAGNRTSLGCFQKF